MATGGSQAVFSLSEKKTRLLLANICERFPNQEDTAATHCFHVAPAALYTAGLVACSRVSL
jgi:hypothetical protein